MGQPRKTPRLFLVDVEASDDTPFSGLMTEFGIVDFETGCGFHGHLWDFEPHPDIPAIPVPTEFNPGFTATTPGNQAGFDGVRRNIDLLSEDREFRVYSILVNWLRRFTGEHERPLFVSDNPAYDWMWLAYGFDSHHMDNPFGHSARRIGDLAAGLDGDWMNTSGWKDDRVTVHDHNPANDALGNAEALRTVLLRHGQIAADA